MSIENLVKQIQSVNDQANKLHYEIDAKERDLNILRNRKKEAENKLAELKEQLFDVAKTTKSSGKTEETTRGSTKTTKQSSGRSSGKRTKSDTGKE